MVDDMIAGKEIVIALDKFCIEMNFQTVISLATLGFFR